MFEPTIPPGPEVMTAQATRLDPTLRHEVATLRAELEPLATAIIPLIRRVVALSDWRCDAYKAATGGDGAPMDTNPRGLEATPGGQRHR